MHRHARLQTFHIKVKFIHYNYQTLYDKCLSSHLIHNLVVVFTFSLVNPSPFYRIAILTVHYFCSIFPSLIDYILVSYRIFCADHWPQQSEFFSYPWKLNRLFSWKEIFKVLFSFKPSMTPSCTVANIFIQI